MNSSTKGKLMTLADLASIGSFVSGFAVLISLIYVAVQIRQAERNQRTLLQQATSSRNLEAVKHWGEPAVASAYLKALSGDTEFTAMEVYQLTHQHRITLTSVQDSFMLHNLSLINKVHLEGMLRSIKQLFGQPVMRALWNTTQQRYSPEFVEWINAHTKDVPLRGPTDIVETLRVALTSVKAAATN
jgi:hypothetical protein